MGINIVHFLRRNPCLIQGSLHSTGTAFAPLCGSGNVIGITGSTIAYKFCIDVRSSGQCMIQRLQNQDASSFGHDKSISVRREGTACSLGIIISSGECPHGTESANRKRGNTGFRTAGDNQVCCTGFNGSVGFSQGVGSRCTSSHRCKVWTFQIKIDCHLCRCHIDNHHGNHERADSFYTLL